MFAIDIREINVTFIADLFKHSLKLLTLNFKNIAKRNLYCLLMNNALKYVSGKEFGFKKREKTTKETDERDE